MTISTNKRSALLTAYLVFLAWCVAAAALPHRAAALTPPSKLTQFPEETTSGSGANELAGLSRLAIDPTNGHVYASDGNRVNEFTAWGEFVKAWGWGVRDGAAEPQTCGPAEPELSPPHSLCQAGIAGSGSGQIGGADGIAVGPEGDIYLRETQNLRVQRFSASGTFVLMFGLDVNKTKVEEGAPAAERNVCPVASGDVCGAGVEGSGPGQLEQGYGGIGDLAIAPDGTVYVPGSGRIQEFDSDGHFLREIALPEASSTLGEFPLSMFFDVVSKTVGFAYVPAEPLPSVPIYKLDPTTGAVVQELHAETPSPGEEIKSGQVTDLATDALGNTFVILDPSGGAKAETEPRVLEFGPAGEILIGFDQTFAAPPTAALSGSAIELLSIATNPLGDLYVNEFRASSPPMSTISVYGPPPTPYGPPPALPPTIGEQFASSVDTTGATLQAVINPHFWSDTNYYVEYGPLSCETSSCTASAGALLTKEVVNTPLRTAGVSLSGLQPGTTYHYRFVAHSGGGEARGLSGKSGEAAEGTFTTYPADAAQPPCPGNDAFRTGPAARLPDCRAYEMVSPADKNGADIETVFNSNGFSTALDQAAADGESITYSAYRAFGGAVSSPYTSQYIAGRTSSGWQSTGISPPRSGASLYTTQQLDSQYKGFTADLCHGWLLQDTDQSLGEGWVEGSPTVYRRDLCPANGPYTAIAPLRMPTVSPIFEFIPELQGFSADGSVALVQANGKLSNNSSTVRQVYEGAEGGLRLVCILPSGKASKEPCSAGAGGSSQRQDRVGNLQHAISEDGRRIYWSESEGGEVPSRLYLRIDHAETKAVYAPPKAVPPEQEPTLARFWGAAADGSAAVYSVGAELRRYSLASEFSVKVAGGFQGIAAISQDAQRVYFTSSEAIAGSGANPLGGEATANKHNLYLYEAGEPARVQFVARLSQIDAGGGITFPNDTSPWPIFHAARTTPDGGALAFTSTESLTGYDNADLQSGQPDAEVYLYRVAGNTLTCASCKPTGARPRGRELEEGFWPAAYLPAAESQLRSSQLLSDDGQRLFFNALDSLSLHDTNGRQDVYQWEAAGKGSCTESSRGFDPKTGGCLSLISSGESPVDSGVVDTSSDGRDVFLTTAQSLFPTDPGLVDVYDARAGGGFPAPAAPPAACEGEACQGPIAPSDDPTPASSAFQGAGNVHPPKHRKKHRRKHHKKHRKHKHHHNRRAGR